MNDKRFMTSISPNTGDTPHWNDVFLVERIPVRNDYYKTSTLISDLMVF